MTFPTNLPEHPDLTDLIALLPPDAERDVLAGEAGQCTMQLISLLQEETRVARRIEEITSRLPNHSGRQATALRDERRTLLVDQLALPADLRTAAANYTGATSVWAAHVHQAAERERGGASAALAATETEYRAARSHMERVDPADDRYPGLFEQFQTISTQRKPIQQRREQMKELIATLDEQVNAVINQAESRTAPLRQVA